MNDPNDYRSAMASLGKNPLPAMPASTGIDNGAPQSLAITASIPTTPAEQRAREYLASIGAPDAMYWGRGELRNLALALAPVLARDDGLMPDPTDYIERLQRELQDSRLLLAAIIRQNGGSLHVHRQYFEDTRPRDEIESWRHHETGAMVYQLNSMMEDPEGE